jgi:chromosome segregation ATPase
MLMIVILVGILLAAFGVSAWMWFQLQQEAKSVQENSAVPLADVRILQSPVDPARVDLSEALEQQRLGYEDRLRELKEELEAVQLKVEQGQGASADRAASLQAENEALNLKVSELEASSLAVSRDGAKVDQLVVENSALRGQVAEASSELARLKGSVSRLEQENLQLKDASSQGAESERLIQQAKEEYQRQLDHAFKQVEELRAENMKLQECVAAGAQAGALQQAVDELSGKVRELEMTLAIQAEKNVYLQYELTKSRAQVVGLERVCESV